MNKYPEEFHIVVFEFMGRWGADWSFKHDGRPFGARIRGVEPDEILPIVARDVADCYKRLLAE